MTNCFHRLAYQFVVKSVTRKAKKIIAVSGNTKKDIIKAFGISDEKIVVVYNGVGSYLSDVEPTSRPDLMKSLDYKSLILYTGVWRDHKILWV